MAVLKSGTSLVPGDMLIGQRGGRTYIEDIEESNIVMGSLAVETEHGFLYLDPEDEYEVAED